MLKRMSSGVALVLGCGVAADHDASDVERATRPATRQPQRGTIEDPADPDESVAPVDETGRLVARIVRRRGPVLWLDVYPAHAQTFFRAWQVECDSFGWVPSAAVIDADAQLPTALPRAFGERGASIAADLARYRGQWVDCTRGGVERALGCLFLEPDESWVREPQLPHDDRDAFCLEYEYRRGRVTRLRLGGRPEWIEGPWPTRVVVDGP